ncbi:hypothetical protein PFISCL1PPCAC_12536, partial [Pristionchus fissidentatus]
MRLLALLLSLPTLFAILPVQETETREVRSLNGLWSFVRDTYNGPDIGLTQKWFAQDLSRFENSTVMPVPSSYNDLGDASLRDHVGWVWYQRKEIISTRHSDQRIYLRIDSANYYSIVYVNSVEVGRHVGGHIPFEFDVTKQIHFGSENRFTVALNNTISWQTVPNADFNYVVQKDNISGVPVDRYPPGYFNMKGNFDFFHYAGIMRPVRLLFRPNLFINDFMVNAQANGSLTYSFALTGNGNYYSFSVEVADARGDTVYSHDKLTGSTLIDKAQLWWPRGLGAPYLYTITARVYGIDGATIDEFRTTFGFRSVTFDADKVYWNGKPFYCQGFGMHEEADIRGRAFDTVMMTKDLNLLEWTGANCYRTSHYPYAEERIYEGDRRGISVILETPAVGLKSFSSANAQLHADMAEEMMLRDRNHPSIFMWSMSNEPQTYRPESTKYFQTVIDRARSLNVQGIPITAVYGPSQSYNDYTADLLDVICVNRYYGWYIDIGRLEQIEHSLYNDFTTWKERFEKPLLITEYGAESIPGMHRDPSFVFTEDYQIDLFNRTWNALEQLKKEDKITGEMVWVFADFMTQMDTTRVVGNHKGVFTRQRDPKKAAFAIRDRYMKRFEQ